MSSTLVDWPSIALLSAATFGIVNNIDSHLLSRRFTSLRMYLLPISIFFFVWGILALYLYPLPADVTLWQVLVAVISGLVRAVAINTTLFLLQKEEVSRVIPLTYTYPVYVAIIAVLFLGERLHYLQWLAVFIVVAGAVMILAEQRPSSLAGLSPKLIFILFGASLFFAVADTTGKYVLTSGISFWSLFGLNSLCLAAVSLPLSLHPDVLRRFRDLKQKKETLALLVFNETLSPVGSVLSFLALQRGPVSLVSTLLSSRPVFVLIFAFLLSRLFPDFVRWRMGKGTLALRFMATAMIFAGIAIIYST